MCWVCGGDATEGMHWRKWSGANFVNQNKVKAPSEQYVCSACVHISSRISPVPGRPPKDGKKYGGNFRNYTHLFDLGGSPSYVNASKGQKPIILDWLRKPHAGPWFAAVADSGQKHVIPWAPVNPPGTRRGLVLFDETLVKVPVHGSPGWDLVPKMAALLTMGATKAEMETGSYTPRAWSLCGEALATFEEDWGWKRGGSWFALAMWLAQRDEEKVAERLAEEKEQRRVKTQGRRQRKAQNADGGSAAGGTKIVPARGRKRDQALGPDRGAHARRDADERKPGGVVHSDPQGPGNPGGAECEQLDLFA